tara:strand:+ start:10476 stop:10646 length:171 start_codon:yes stop_codon:yes gene_type:complete
MPKIHLKTVGIDARQQGQTEFEYENQTMCGYVRKNVTRDIKKVTCFFCRKKSINEQ